MDLELLAVTQPDLHMLMGRPGDPIVSSIERPADFLVDQVDPLSLSCLLSHGFEEGPARRALRKTMNDTQVSPETSWNG